MYLASQVNFESFIIFCRLTLKATIEVFIMKLWELLGKVRCIWLGQIRSARSIGKKEKEPLPFW